MLKNPWWQATAWMILGDLVLAGAALYWGWIAPTDWIGWIQAVGSVEAILAAVFIAQAEHWRQAEAERIAERSRRDALVLELLPQLVLLNAWVKQACRFIEQLKANTDANLMVKTIETYRAIPKALKGDTSRLMLLGDTAGVRAVQVRELLRMANDALRGYGQDFYMQNAPKNIVPLPVAARYRLILSMERITGELLREVTAMHDEIIPVRDLPSALPEIPEDNPPSASE